MHSAASIVRGDSAVGVAFRREKVSRALRAACTPASKARPRCPRPTCAREARSNSSVQQQKSVTRRKAGQLGLLGLGLVLPESQSARADVEGYQSFSYDGRSLRTLPITGAPLVETKEQAPAAPSAPIEFKTFEEEEVGYQIDIPKDWDVEVPSLYKREIHAPGDYKGKRVTIEVDALGKLEQPTLNLLATPQEYAEQITEGIRKLNQGATGTVINANERDGGRIYFYEYRINSLEPQLVWGLAGVGLGQNESARKFRLRQRVLVTCKVAESGVKQADKELFKKIVASFKFTDQA